MSDEEGRFLIVTSTQVGHGVAHGPTGETKGVVLKFEGIESDEGAEMSGTVFFIPSMVQRLSERLLVALESLDHE
jgi:hypothetical protein